MRVGRAAARALEPRRQRHVFHQRDLRKTARVANAARVTNMAWSPVAMPVRRERRFIMRATSGEQRRRPRYARRSGPRRGRIAPDHRQPSVSAFSGSRVSACRNSRTSPLGRRRAGIHLHGAAARRGEHVVGERARRGRACRPGCRRRPRSTSTPRARDTARAPCNAASIPAASSSTGMMIDSALAAAHSAASFSAPPQLEPWPAVQP